MSTMNRGTRRHAGTFVALLAMACALSACGDSEEGPGANADTQASLDYAKENIPGLSPDVVTEACKEGTFSLYSLTFGGKLKSVMDAFGEAFPCMNDPEVLENSGGATATRFESEVASGRPSADLVMNLSGAVMLQFVKDGRLAVFDNPTGDNIPEPWKDPEGHYYGVLHAAMGVAWNTDEITEAELQLLEGIETWQDAISPDVVRAFSGRTGTVTIDSGGATEALFHHWFNEYGPESWEAIRDMKPVVYDSIFPLSARLAAGEVVYILPSANDLGSGPLQQEGAPLRWSFPEPAITVPLLMGINAKAENPNAARLFMAWSTSTEGLESYPNATDWDPILSDTEDMRKFAQEPWYELPQEWSVVPWDKINSERADYSARWHKLFD